MLCLTRSFTTQAVWSSHSKLFLSMISCLCMICIKLSIFVDDVIYLSIAFCTDYFVLTCAKIKVLLYIGL